jgi:hypothetical protein
VPTTNSKPLPAERNQWSFTEPSKTAWVVPTGGHSLPEGAAVTIIVRAPEQPNNGSLRDLLLEFAGTIDDLPPDMAEQHDHYIHGRPK